MIHFNHKILILSSLFVLVILGIGSQDAHAIDTIIDDQLSCESIPGALWDSGNCIITTDLTISSGETLTVDDCCALSIDPGVTITIEHGGNILLVGFATLYNSGTIYVHGGIGSMGTQIFDFLPFSYLDNSGTIHNFGFIYISQIDNQGVINSCDGGVSYDFFLGNPVTSDCPCTPPVSGNWVINYSCTMDTAELVNGDLIVHNDNILTLGATGILDVFGDVMVENFSGINILNGATFWVHQN